MHCTKYWVKEIDFKYYYQIISTYLNLVDVNAVKIHTFRDGRIRAIDADMPKWSRPYQKYRRYVAEWIELFLTAVLKIFELELEISDK